MERIYMSKPDDNQNPESSQNSAPHVHGPNCNHGHHHDNAPFVRSAPKIGANDTCHCGSGKKFKKCCRK
jgi:uncharacterized protein YecA (UPF0149 family)